MFLMMNDECFYDYDIHHSSLYSIENGLHNLGRFIYTLSVF